jgi:uncharacterized protein (TIGR03435 family)
MLQNLLAERLKLKLHHEQKEMATFELTIGKKGLNMKASAPDAPRRRKTRRGRFRNTP